MYSFQCFGRNDGPLRPTTTCISVTNSPTVTARVTTAFPTSSTMSRHRFHSLLQPYAAKVHRPKGSGVGQDSPPGGKDGRQNETYPLLLTNRGRAKSLTSASASDLNKVSAAMRMHHQPNYPNLRSGNRKKRRSCTGGIMTESIRLFPNGTGLNATTHIVSPSSCDMECVTQL